MGNVLMEAALEWRIYSNGYGLRKTGRGLVEYTLIVLPVALFFWLGVKDTGVGARLADHWAKVLDCLKSPMACSA